MRFSVNFLIQWGAIPSEIGVVDLDEIRSRLGLRNYPEAQIPGTTHNIHETYFYLTVEEARECGKLDYCSRCNVRVSGFTREDFCNVPECETALDGTITVSKIVRSLDSLWLFEEWQKAGYPDELILNRNE